LDPHFTPGPLAYSTGYGFQGVPVSIPDEAIKAMAERRQLHLGSMAEKHIDAVAITACFAGDMGQCRK
jgi:hypothetical protein